MAALKKAEISAGRSRETLPMKKDGIPANGLRDSSLMRTAPLTRKTPLKATAGLQRTAFKRRAPKKRPGYHDQKYLAACRGEPCFLQIPGVCRGEIDRDTVVHCHANWSAYGKGMGIKAKDIYTVPGCFRCHTCLDQGFSLTDDQKRATWEFAYHRWLPVRAAKMDLP